MRRLARHFAAMMLAIVTAACQQEPAAQHPGSSAEPDNPARVVVYAAVDADAFQVLLNEFSQETGVVVYLVSGTFSELADRRHNPGSRPPADLFVAGNGRDLHRAVEQDIFRPTHSAVIEQAVPEHLREPDGRWVALAIDTRPVMYRRDLVSDAELADIADYRALADERWRGRLCLASSSVGGNHTLIAAMISQLGIRDAELSVRGWRANLGIAVRSDDAALLESLDAGECQLGIAASSELGRHRQRQPESQLEQLRFANPGAALVDAVGAGVTRHAANPDAARRLLEWLVSVPANSRYARESQRLPVAAGAATRVPGGDPFGDRPPGPTLAGLGFLLEDASRLAERARYP